MKENTSPAAEEASASMAIRTDATVHSVIDRAVANGQITADQGEQIFWLHGHSLDHSLTLPQLSRNTGISKATLSQIFSGKYPAEDWTQIIARIVKYRKESDDLIRNADCGFIETTTAKLIFNLCKQALYDNMPSFIYGASHLGKTCALEEFVRRCNSSAIKYLRCRSGMSKTRLARLLGKCCHLRNLDRLSSNDIIDGVVASLNDSSLLILDEFHMCLNTVKPDVSRQLVEFIREIYDLSKCGLVLCSTRVGLAALEDGPNRLVFDQLRRRGILKVVLADVPPVKDINDFSRAYNLPCPHGDELLYVKSLIKTRGLGVFCAYLANARRKIDNHNAKNPDDQKTLDWDYFLALAKGFESLSNIEPEY